MSLLDSTSVQSRAALYGKFARSCFSNWVFRLRQRRSLISAQRWALATLGSELTSPWHNSEGVASSLDGNRRNSFRVVAEKEKLLSQGFEANPGLKLANVVGVQAGRPSAIRTYPEAN
jgi:hypothetical protein